jgi:hypothetical protein
MIHVELAVSHQVPSQVADRGVLITYIDGGYRGNKMLDIKITIFLDIMLYSPMKINHVQLQCCFPPALLWYVARLILRP